MRLHPLTGGNTRRQFLFLLGMPLLCMHGQAQAQEQLLGFDSLYLSNTVLGLKFSTQTLAAKGKNVRMRGYMAPPLKPESNFLCLPAIQWQFAHFARLMRNGPLILW